MVKSWSKRLRRGLRAAPPAGNRPLPQRQRQAFWEAGMLVRAVYILAAYRAFGAVYNNTALWLRSERIDGLHFETCYYQGIDYCLQSGLKRFEPGAQGEHKLARGFLPVLVRSRHWIAHREFREALRDWCDQEAASVRRYAANLMRHSPFKRG